MITSGGLSWKLKPGWYLYEFPDSHSDIYKFIIYSWWIVGIVLIFQIKNLYKIRKMPEINEIIKIRIKLCTCKVLSFLIFLSLLSLTFLPILRKALLLTYLPSIFLPAYSSSLIPSTIVSFLSLFIGITVAI